MTNYRTAYLEAYKESIVFIPFLSTFFRTTQGGGSSIQDPASSIRRVGEPQGVKAPRPHPSLLTSTGVMCQIFSAYSRTALSEEK